MQNREKKEDGRIMSCTQIKVFISASKKKKNRRAQQRCVILCQKRKNVVANDVRLQNPIFLSDTSPCISFESHGWFAK